MQSFNYKIKDPYGVHARPAGLLVREAMKFSCKISIEKNGETADLKKLFSVMSLNIKEGESVKVSFDGADEADARVAIERYMEKNM